MELRARLAAGETVIGTMLSEIYVPNIVRLIRNQGFDFVLIDGEHGYFDDTQIANLTAVADGISLQVLVRTATCDSSVITRLMDIGVRGILLSSTESVEDARRLSELCRYAPEGARSVSTFRAHTGYRHADMRTLMDAANRRTLVLVQIESAHAAAIADQLMAIPGVDGAVIGPNDMSQDMGILGQYQHPLMEQAIKKTIEAARKAGKWSGIITTNPGLIEEAKQLGMSFFSIGSELNMMANGAKLVMDRFGRLKEA